MTDPNRTDDDPSGRIEHDTLGDVVVPADAAWGAQTQRALENFDVGGQRFPIEIVHAIATIKAAAASVSGGRDDVRPDADAARAIEAVAAAVATGAHDDQFPLDVLQTGSGTSSNMNVNEVVAHVASGALGRPVHPNDDVNACQSSNDVVPTAIRLAADAAVGRTVAALGELAGALDAKAAEFADVVKMGRTHLMDAAPVTLGWEFAGWAAQVRNAAAVADGTRGALLRVPLGGTAVGTGLNAPAGWADAVVGELARRLGRPVSRTPHAFVSQAGQDDLVATAGGLAAVATAQVKVANDLRLLASGPFGGLAEIELPALQPGSSIMPGKVNPVICEAVVQAGYRVIGNQTTVALAASSGTLELNTALPLLGWCLLESAGLMERSARSLATRTVPGITVDTARAADLARRSPALVTALAPVVGYETAAAAAKSMQRGIGVIEALAEVGVTPETVPGLADAVDPSRLARPTG